VASAQFLKQHPLCMCEECLAGELRVRAATVVDHREPHRLEEAKRSGDSAAISRAWALFWSRSNWQAMAKDCHDAKTAREDGGFGNRASDPGGIEKLRGKPL
jgi:5-methylcytosine-specific restriction protein A